MQPHAPYRAPSRINREANWGPNQTGMKTPLRGVFEGASSLSDFGE